MICQLKFQIICQLSVGMFRSKHMICQLKFQTICQLSLNMLRSKHDMSVKILNHLSVVSKDLRSKHDLSVKIYKPSASCQ